MDTVGHYLKSCYPKLKHHGSLAHFAPRLVLCQLGEIGAPVCWAARKQEARTASSNLYHKHPFKEHLGFSKHTPSDNGLKLGISSTADIPTRGTGRASAGNPGAQLALKGGRHHQGSAPDVLGSCTLMGCGSNAAESLESRFRVPGAGEGHTICMCVFLGALGVDGALSWPCAVGGLEMKAWRGFAHLGVTWTRSPNPLFLWLIIFYMHTFNHLTPARICYNNL